MRLSLRLFGFIILQRAAILPDLSIRFCPAILDGHVPVARFTFIPQDLSNSYL